jgi:hypothetical protein
MRAFLIVLLLAASPLALADDAAARAQLVRQQQSDAFALQLQQSIQSFRAGPVAPEHRLELESLQRDQRLRQSESFYRQEVQQQAQPAAAPPADMYRRADQMRFAQERAVDLDRARADAAGVLDRSRPPRKPEPNPEPAVSWGPVLR